MNRRYGDVEDALVRAQCLDRIDRARSTRGKRASQQRHDHSEHRRAGDDGGVVSVNAYQHGASEPAHAESERCAHRTSDQRDAGDMTQHKPANVSAFCPERNANAELAQPLRHAVGEHRIQTDGRQHRGKHSECG